MAFDFGVLARHAETLRALHHTDEPLVLPNAWDVPSARSVEPAGFPAVATTSAGVAATLGYPDGQVIPADVMFSAIARIAAAVEVPVTADVEAGYGLGAPELIERLLTAGAVGLNLEDSDRDGDESLVPVETHAQRVADVKAAGRAAGVDVVVNARVDVYVRQAEPALELALERATAYVEAGADCVFPILVRDEDDIVALVAASGTVNVYWREGWPSIARLGELGVRRISFGSGVHREAVDHIDEFLRGIKRGIEAEKGIQGG
jgi:2-methylisocitrate lyase-like PEP mutase family enzyme